MKQTLKTSAKAGFTLVELAIVLVIIGLIVGGVLVGQDLIKAAEIRSTMSDVEKYNAAATAFRNKYNGLPGDLLSTKASQFGMTSRAGTAGQGDGNSLLEGCGAGDTTLGCETALFWVDLTTAQLIDSAFSTATDAAVTDANTAANVPNYLPNAPVRDTAYIHVFPTSGRNYFAIGNHQFDASGDLSYTSGSDGLNPLEASQIDEKADDGLPATGIIRSITGWSDNRVLPVLTTATDDDTAGLCHADNLITGTVTYNTGTDDNAGALTCDIYYRASF